MICPICSGDMQRALDLPRFPMTEQFEPWAEAFEPGRGLVDQALAYCEPCSYAALEVVVPPAQLYGAGYRTATAGSLGASQSVIGFHTFIAGAVNEDNYGTVIDIGANDASLLAFFPQARRIAIDPNASGDAELVRRFVDDVDLSEYARLRKLILCSHTLEHLPEPATLLSRLYRVMSADDVCAFQFPSLDSLVRDARIDQVHHQHLHYFSLRAFSLLLAKTGFEVIAHEFDDAHYGTLRIAFRKGVGEVAGERIPEWRLACAVSDFRVQMGAFRAAIRSLRSPVCYGASLMFPVLEYWAPELATVRDVIDEDESKWGLRWINADHKIVEPRPLYGCDLVISAFNTKLAVRAIASKLFKVKARTVVVPFNAM